MSFKGKKNIAVVPLFLITIAVWGLIIYNIIIRFTGSKMDEDESINYSLGQNAADISKTDDQANEEISYEELDRDPFALYKPHRKKEGGNTSAVEIRPFTAPPVKPKFVFSISGVVVNDNSRLVILNDADNGETVFLREGSEYKGVEIKSIDVNKVVIIENKEKREIPVSK